MYKISRCCF